MAVTLALRCDGVEQPGVSFDQPRIVIGRGAGCDFRIPDESVSVRHASIRHDGPLLVVVDEGSCNGSFLGASRIEPQVPVRITDGALLRFGRMWVHVGVDAELATVRAAQATREIALGLVANALRAQGERLTPQLVVTEGPDTGAAVDLDDDEKTVVVGRDTDVDLPLTEPDASRRHLQVQRRGDCVVVYEFGSTNGTMLGDSGMPITGEATLRAGEFVRIGGTAIMYKNPAIQALRQIETAPDTPMDLSYVPPPVVVSVRSNEVSGELLSDSSDVASVARPIGKSSQLPEVSLATRDSVSQKALPEGQPAQNSADALETSATSKFASEGSERVQARQPAIVAGVPDAKRIERARPRRGSKQPKKSVNNDAKRKKTRSSWTVTDVLIVLLAFVVLGLSVVGLVWLFGGS